MDARAVKIDVKDKLKREKLLLLSFFLGLVLVAFVVITLGNMFYQQAEDWLYLPGLFPVPASER